jgi:hypothetical protein
VAIPPPGLTIQAAVGFRRMSARVCDDDLAITQCHGWHSVRHEAQVQLSGVKPELAQVTLLIFEAGLPSLLHVVQGFRHDHGLPPAAP